MKFTLEGVLRRPIVDDVFGLEGISPVVTVNDIYRKL